MIDFLMISTRPGKRGSTELYPKFIIKKSNDLMIRGGDFYAIWLDDRGLWSTDEQDALQLIDNELDKYYEEHKSEFETRVKILHMWDAESGMIDSWHKYCQKQSRDNFHMLDEKLIFANTVTSKKDYASKKLSYALEAGDHSNYDRLMSVLYSEEERHKIEWAIGSVITGDSKKIQKFMVLYGAAGTGKSTVLNIIQQLFEGYYSVFDAKALGSSNNSFALEAFKTNPLIAIQHDGDLSHIEDNTRLNSLVSHELMTVNEKFKSTYANRFKCFLFMGTNKPVKITDAKSGLIRRLIDVSPTGEKLGPKEYKETTKQIAFELGAIADYCQNVYLDNPGMYDDYIPVSMLGASNDFYNFVLDSYYVFKEADGISLKQAWEMYKNYCEEAKVLYPLPQRAFKEELKNYFENYKERVSTEDGVRYRSYYEGFITSKFEQDVYDPDIKKESAFVTEEGIIFKEQPSKFDMYCKDVPAQYATLDEVPEKKWDNVGTTLKDIDTSKLHYAKVPENHIVIDFDIPDETGKKCFEKNLAEANKWPATYAELSKSGQGIHLHYIYTGDVSKLSRVYDDHIEVKIFTGKSSLRRKLTKCNNLPIATISSGLPLKGEKMVNFDSIKNEKALRTLIRRNLNKEIHPGTKPSIDFIYKILEDAYRSGMKYDVTDMRGSILAFAVNSTHQSEYCVKLVNAMKFHSDEASADVNNDISPIAFYDIEVFPNLLLVNWKYAGEGHEVVRMINPEPSEIEDLMKLRLVGFNCRRYDNHIIYARLLGYNNTQLYDLSQKIINGSRNAFFGEAYNVSYTDIYDFCSKKQSLKKWEIELGIHHKELGLPWDQPVPEELWPKVAEYCDNDVIATEAVWNARQADFTARQILADIAGLSVNDTTNTLTTRIIFGGNRNPQDQFNYRFMGDPTVKTHPVKISNKGFKDKNLEIIDKAFENEFNVFDSKNRPMFPGYIFDKGVSTYRGEEVGEGGYVYAEPGMYKNIALLDIASMHPSSIIAEQLFGDEYTKNFQDIRDARVYIKHRDFDKARTMFNGKLEKYLNDESSAKNLAQALKIAINSVYGLTSANFDNPFKDNRNIDNIVAKRGALFMINLKHEVQLRGFKVAHIKTDSIKIPDATPEIISFVMEFGKAYGYTFEHEATYEKMCLVNDAVYVAKYSKDKTLNGDEAGKWTATGTQFQVPYVFKKLFSHEEIVFDDLCETKAVTSALYLDMNEKLPDVTKLEQELFVITKGNREFDRQQELKEKLIPAGHNYIFIGKVGQFCPIKPGRGGGLLMREMVDKNGEVKYGAAVGTKGYRWLESENVRLMHKEADIDRTYYDDLVTAAVNDISQFGDFSWFIAEDDVPWFSDEELKQRGINVQ